MKGSFKTALIAAVVSAFVAAGAAVATTQAFTLGTTNTVDAASTVTAGATGLNAKMLQLTNNSTGSSATALGLSTPNSRPPMIVTSSAKVANLNADKLDGTDSGGFVAADAVRRVGPITVPASNAPQPVTIAVIRQLTVRGSCFHFADNNERSDIEIISSVAHSAYSAFSQSGSATYGEPDMNAGQPYFLGTLFLSPGGQPAFKVATGDALSADGHQISFDLYQGQNVRGQVGKCVFGGTFVVK